MNRKLLAIIILAAVTVVCYTSAFVLFFDWDKVGTSIKNSPAGPVLSEIGEAMKDGFNSPSGCKPSDFSGEIDKISMSAVSADIKVATSDSSFPGVSDVENVSCERTGKNLHIKVPAFSSMYFNKNREEGDFSLKGKVTDDVILYLSGKQNIEVELKNISGDIEAGDINPAKLTVNTKSGDINVKKISGELFLNSISGDIRAELPETALNVNAGTISGVIDVEVKPSEKGAEASAQSTSGNIRIDLPPADHPDQHIKAETVSGDIRIRTR